MAERNKVLVKTYNETDQVVEGVPAKTARFTFLDSKNVLDVALSTLSADIVTRAALHGILQKAGDAAAGESGEDAEEAVTGVIEMLLAGNWSAAREKGEARPSVVAEAVFEFKKSMGKLGDETLEQIVARYAGKDGAKARATAMKRPEVAAIIERKKIERAQAKLAKLQAATAPTGDVATL